MAPACVAACPEGAIAIEIVNVAEWRRDYLSADAPGLPPADDSISTTRITLPENLLPDTGRVDTQRIVPEHPHWPLVFMLVLTQLSAGAFAALWILDLLRGGAGSSVSALVSLALRASASARRRCIWGARFMRGARCKGLRRSWLSREVLTLSRFAGVAATYAGMLFLNMPGRPAAGLMTRALRCVGMMCSARIYIVRARPAWIQPLYHGGILFDRPAAGSAVRARLLGAQALHGSGRLWLARRQWRAARRSCLTQALKFLWLSQSETFELHASALLLSGRFGTRFLTRLAIAGCWRNRAAARVSAW